MRPARPLKAQEYLRFTSGLVARRSDFDQEYLRRRGFSDPKQARPKRMPPKFEVN